MFLSTLGFGRGNLNDAMMEAISDHGNGNYHYIDNRTEARRVLVEEMTGTLVTIAKDVKIQVEFNPAKVAGYRLIGYEKRMLRTEDFNDDKKDAGEIGAGHTVTALYEIVPAGKKVEVGPVEDLKYQKPATTATVRKRTRQAASTSRNNELLTLKMRYKAPDGDTSKKLEWPITDDGKSFAAASDDMKFAAAVAGFGLLLRDSQYKGNLTYAAVLELAQSGVGEDPHGYRKEFLEMVRKAKELRHESANADRRSTPKLRIALCFAQPHLAAFFRSPHVAQFQRVAVTHQHLPPQPRMIRMFEPRVGRKELLRFAAGLFQNRPIAPQIGHSQRRQAVLLRAEQIARAAEFKIHFRQLEAIARRRKRIEPRAGLLRQSIRPPAGRKSPASLPRPTRPRSWCNCASPNRSGESITMMQALGTSTPTSITLVETSTCVWPARKLVHRLRLSPPATSGRE